MALSIIFVDFYVPSFTPRLHPSEAALQVCDNITSFMMCGFVHVSSEKKAGHCDIIYTQTIQGWGQEGTWRDPGCIPLDVDISLPAETLNFLIERKELISFIKLVESCNVDNLYNKPRSHVISKVFFRYPRIPQPQTFWKQRCYIP